MENTAKPCYRSVSTTAPRGISMAAAESLLLNTQIWVSSKVQGGTMGHNHHSEGHKDRGPASNSGSQERCAFMTLSGAVSLCEFPQRGYNDLEIRSKNQFSKSCLPCPLSNIEFCLSMMNSP